MFIILIFKRILFYLFFITKINQKNILYILFLFLFIPKQTAFCESIDVEDYSTKYNKYYYIAGIILIGVCITALFYFNNDNSSTGEIVSLIPDVVIKGINLPAQHVIVQLSNIDSNAIHWSNYGFKELMTMSPSTPVAFLEYTPKFDQDPLEIMYKLIDIKTLKSMSLKGSTHF
jgi:hypothetical protein